MALVAKGENMYFSEIFFYGSRENELPEKTAVSVSVSTEALAGF